MKTLLELGQQQRSGILEGYSCCLLSRDPSFLEQDAKGAQVLLLFLSQENKRGLRGG